MLKWKMRRLDPAVWLVLRIPQSLGPESLMIREAQHGSYNIRLAELPKADGTRRPIRLPGRMPDRAVVSPARRTDPCLASPLARKRARFPR